MRGDSGGGGGVGGVPGHRRPRSRLRRLHLSLCRHLGGRAGRHRRGPDRRHHHPHRHPRDAGRRPDHRHHPRAARPRTRRPQRWRPAPRSPPNTAASCGSRPPGPSRSPPRSTSDAPCSASSPTASSSSPVVSVRRGCRATSPTAASHRHSNGWRSATHRPAGPGWLIIWPGWATPTPRSKRPGWPAEPAPAGSSTGSGTGSSCPSTTTTVSWSGSSAGSAPTRSTTGTAPATSTHPPHHCSTRAISCSGSDPTRPGSRTGGSPCCAKGRWTRSRSTSPPPAPARPWSGSRPAGPRSPRNTRHG